MKDVIKDMIEEYQCSGCVSGPYPECFEKDDYGFGCKKHCPGTIVSNTGTIFLGLPKGFDRIGNNKKIYLYLFNKFPNNWGEYDMFNVPVWMYLDTLGNTIVKGISPRITQPFVHVYHGNVLNKIDCLELTKKDIDEMD